MEVVAEDVTHWKASSFSPLSTLRREGLTPPSTPPHSWWQTARSVPARPPSAASVEWFDGEAARPPSRSIVRYSTQRVYGSEGGLCGSLLGGPRESCASAVVGATKERNLWAEPKRAAKAMLGTKRFVPIRLHGRMDPASRDGYRLVPNTDAPVERPTNGPGNPGERAARSQQPTGPRLDFALEDPGKQWIAEKALRVMRHDSAGFATVDATSVYGAALALPQLARSAGWTISYTGLALRGLLFMIMNNLLQGFLLYMISKEERIINKFGSQMFLCDFAAHHQNCPHGSNCVGPGGTVITPSRLYDFDLWSTRTFVRDSFKLLFPEKEQEIMDKIDPGEYGVESYYLRTVCCFLFVLGLWHDLAGSWDMLDLLWCVPADSERWIVPTAGQKPQEEEIGVSQAYTDAALHEMIELDFVQFRVAGMPLHWKLFNLFCLLCPKIYLWLLTVDIGIVFLMETSEIEDMIINCVALGFILQIAAMQHLVMFHRQDVAVVQFYTSVLAAVELDFTDEDAGDGISAPVEPSNDGLATDAAPAMPIRPDPHSHRSPDSSVFFYSACVARPVDRKERAANPKAKAALDKEWNKLINQGCWDYASEIPQASIWQRLEQLTCNTGFDQKLHQLIDSFLLTTHPLADKQRRQYPREIMDFIDRYRVMSALAFSRVATLSGDAAGAREKMDLAMSLARHCMHFQAQSFKGTRETMSNDTFRLMGPIQASSNDLTKLPPIEISRDAVNHAEAVKFFKGFLQLRPTLSFLPGSFLAIKALNRFPTLDSLKEQATHLEGERKEHGYDLPAVDASGIGEVAAFRHEIDDENAPLMNGWISFMKALVETYPGRCVSIDDTLNWSASTPMTYEDGASQVVIHPTDGWVYVPAINSDIYDPQETYLHGSNLRYLWSILAHGGLFGEDYVTDDHGSHEPCVWVTGAAAEAASSYASGVYLGGGYWFQVMICVSRTMVNNHSRTTKKLGGSQKQIRVGTRFLELCGIAFRPFRLLDDREQGVSTSPQYVVHGHRFLSADGTKAVAWHPWMEASPIDPRNLKLLGNVVAKDEVEFADLSIQGGSTTQQADSNETEQTGPAGADDQATAGSDATTERITVNVAVLRRNHWMPDSYGTSEHANEGRIRPLFEAFRKVLHTFRSKQLCFTA
ncbi:NITA [Symbiodinium sp. CCMP2592]|nr:NITA [Symbiodinium sp. CCMP2592]